MAELAVITLGNGCFWCTEAIFQQVAGVISVISGYSGGEMAHPDYETVCTGVTGHAECLQITYDPAVVSLKELLEIFFETHDPTTLNRQGNDVGSQYRSVIFYHGEEEKKTAADYIIALEQQKKYNDPIVTTLEPYSKFYPAENYHLDYYNKHGIAPYCQFVIKPKVQKFKKQFGDKLKVTS